MDAHVQECTEVCGVIYFQRCALDQGAAAGVVMKKLLSGDSGFFTRRNKCVLLGGKGAFRVSGSKYQGLVCQLPFEVLGASLLSRQDYDICSSRLRTVERSLRLRC